MSLTFKQKQPLYPLEFEPISKTVIWGGDYLAKNLNKPFSLNENVGESWELSDLGDDVSIISNGALKGKSIRDAIVLYGYENIVGKKTDDRTIFPLLIKYIEAKDKLSIQVHPDDEYAKKHFNSYGKTEMWVVLDTLKEDAKLLVGMNKCCSVENLKDAITDNKDISDMFNYIDVSVGDVIYLPAGRVHAILDGVVIAEIQQSSNITFRLYDWGRLDGNGNARDLHIKESFDVIKKDDDEPIIIKSEYQEIEDYKYCSLIKNMYFDVSKILLESNGIYKSFTDNSFEIIMLLDGNVVIESDNYKIEINKGNTILIPACLSDVVVKNIGLKLATILSIKR